MLNISLRKLAHRYSPAAVHPFIKKIEASDIGSRLATGVFWSMGGAVVSRGMMLAASILVARILGKEVYGEYGIIRSTVNMFLVFAGFGLGMTATKYVAEYCGHDPARTGRIIAISGLFAMITGLLVTIGIWVFADVLATRTLNAPHLAGALRIGALIMFFNCLNGAQTGALAGFEAFKTIAHVNLGVGLTSLPLLVGGAYWGGLTGAVWALCISMAINWLLNHIALRKEVKHFNIPFTFKDCIKELPVLWHFSLPAFLSGVMFSPVLWLCNAMLVNQPEGYGQMGVYNAVNQWSIAILFVPSMVCRIVLPMLSSLNSNDDQTRYKKVLKYNVIINGLVALVIALPVIVFSRYIMALYGAGFAQAFWVLICMAFCSILIAVNNIVGQAIASKGKMWIGLLFNSLWSIVLLTASFILIRQGYGALGLAYATLIAYIFHTIWQSVYLAAILGRNG
jgi:O-antigen/teichoic acid export membrane protein